MGIPVARRIDIEPTSVVEGTVRTKIRTDVMTPGVGEDGEKRREAKLLAKGGGWEGRRIVKGGVGDPRCKVTAH